MEPQVKTRPSGGQPLTYEQIWGTPQEAAPALPAELCPLIGGPCTAMHAGRCMNPCCPYQVDAFFDY